MPKIEILKVVAGAQRDTSYSISRYTGSPQSDFPAKLLPPTSMGKHLARHPHLWHSSTSSVYFSLFLSLASSILSSQGIVSSNKKTCLDDSDSRTMSGLKLVCIMFSGNRSCFPRKRLFWSMAGLMDLATAFSTWSWRQR